VDGNYQLKDVEATNRDLIKEKLQGQLEKKKAYFLREIASYEAKYDGLMMQPLSEKKLADKRSFYEHQLHIFRKRLANLEQEFAQLVEQCDQAEPSSDALESFFSGKHLKLNSSVNDGEGKRLMVITVEDTHQFYMSQLFYSLLFPHQVKALHWLLHQHVRRRGSILADEMGLGKTISAIALMSTLYTTQVEKRMSLDQED